MYGYTLLGGLLWSHKDRTYHCFYYLVFAEEQQAKLSDATVSHQLCAIEYFSLVSIYQIEVIH